MLNEYKLSVLTCEKFSLMPPSQWFLRKGCALRTSCTYMTFKIIIVDNYSDQRKRLKYEILGATNE